MAAYEECQAIPTNCQNEAEFEIAPDRDFEYPIRLCRFHTASATSNFISSDTWGGDEMHISRLPA